MALQDYVDIATIVGVTVAVVALTFAAYQVRQNANINRGRFWLELERMFRHHDDVHMKLRIGGEWSRHPGGKEIPVEEVKGPSEVGVAEWAEVEDYMGLFEHCNKLLDLKLIDLKTFQDIFGYRVGNILSNPVIVWWKLQREREYWKDFIALVRKLGWKVPDYSTVISQDLAP